MSKGGRFAKGNKNAREQLKKQIEEQPVEQGGEQTKQKKQEVQDQEIQQITVQTGQSNRRWGYE